MSAGVTALFAAALAFGALAPRDAGAAGVEFYAVTDKEEVGLEQTLTLTVTLALDSQDGSEEVRLPEAPDFQVLSRSQSQQMSFNMTGGGPPSFRRVRVYTVLLEPKRVGTFTIAPGKLVVKGKAYETGAIKVKVSATAAAPRQPPRPQAQPNPLNPFGIPDPLSGDAEDFFNQFLGSGDAARPASDSDIYLRNHVDKKQAWLGEQITLSTYLFSRVDISGVNSFKMPKLDGFWAEDLETPSQITGELKTIDGVPYRVFLLRRRALFPIKSGKLTIEPVEVDVSTGFSLVFSGRDVHRVSQPVTIDVQSLPPGAAASFQPANVGDWRLAAEASPLNVQLGQPVTLRVTLEGTGNLRNIALPPLPAAPGLKVYDPTNTEKISTAKNRFGGKRTLEYLLMPTQTGSFEIPALTFAYFDPTKGSYRTAATEPIPVRVEAGGIAQGQPCAGQPSGGSTLEEHAVNLLGASGLRPLRYKGELSRRSPALWRAPYFLPVVLSPFALWLGLSLVGLARVTLRRQDEGARKRNAGSRTRKRLRTAEGLLRSGKADAFYSEVSRALHDYLADKLGSPVSGLTRAELRARLTASGVCDAALERLTAVLDTCDAGRFAPGGSEASTLARVHGEALAVMEELESMKLSQAPEQEVAR